MDEWMDLKMDGWMDRPLYRGARTHLKTSSVGFAIDNPDCLQKEQDQCAKKRDYRNLFMKLMFSKRSTAWESFLSTVKDELHFGRESRSGNGIGSGSIKL